MAKIKSRQNNHHTKPKSIDKRSFERVYWPYLPLVLIIGVLLTFGTTSGNLAAYVRHPGGRVLSYATSMSISGLLADTNASRAANGVAGLTLNQQLDAAAQASADDMAARNYWSHTTPDGNPPWVWVSAQGYSYQKLGQNLATGFTDEQSTIDGWMNSPPHRENLLDSDFQDVGFGYANNPNYTSAGGGPMTIVVAFYGRPQVAAATAPVAPAPKPPATKPTPAAPAPVAQAPAPTPPAVAEPTPQPANSAPTKPEPLSTQTENPTLAAPIKQSRIQLALTNSKVSPAATSASIIIALAALGFLASRHLKALHRFLIKGERYAIRHPLTDLAVLFIACLLFILSQTAGIIR